MDRLDGGLPATSAPPYPLTGLPARPCGIVAGLDRGAPAEVLLERVVREALAGRPAAGTGLVVGTASGNVCGPWERWNRGRLRGEVADEEGTGRDAPALRVAARLGLGGPVTTVSVACVSGAAALGVGAGWLRDGLCERVVCVGLDTLSEFVHAGFAGLGAIGAGTPRPFRADRDGMMLGEGAAALLLEARPVTAPLAWLRASRSACDAHHMTTPDPTGRGAVAAIRAALLEAGLRPDEVDGVSVHGTATRANDAMEAAALGEVFGRSPPLWAVKAIIGHTMGAAGAIEAAVAVAALRRGRIPTPLVPGPAGSSDMAAALRVGPRDGPARVLLTMSSAFGGTHAANVFALDPGPVAEADVAVVEGPVFEGIVVRSDLAWPDAPPAWSRATDYVRAGLLAVRGLVALKEDLPADAALVLASRTTCREVDRAHHERLVTEGSARASRRTFVGTLPGAPVFEASLLWGVRGPALAFVDGRARAEEEARRLVRHGAARMAVAVSVEGERIGGPSVVSAASYRRAP